MAIAVRRCKPMVVLRLAAGDTHAEIAERFGISERTVDKVAVQDADRVLARRAAMVERAAGALADGLIVAARRLRHEADHAPEPRDRIAAARALLDKLVVLRPPAPTSQPESTTALASVPTEVLRRLVLTAGQATLAYEERVTQAGGTMPPPPLTGTPGGAAVEQAPAPPSVLPVSERLPDRSSSGDLGPG